MRPTLIAVFLALMPAFPPVPRETTENQVTEQQAEAHKVQANKGPSTKRPVRQSQNPQAAAAYTSKHATQNENSTNPPAPIAVKPVRLRKDTWDYAYIVATLIIASVTLVLAVGGPPPTTT